MKMKSKKVKLLKEIKKIIVKILQMEQQEQQANQQQQAIQFLLHQHLHQEFKLIMTHRSGQISKQNILNGSYASSTSANESDGTIHDSTSSASSNKLTNNETRANEETSFGKEKENYLREKTIQNSKLTKSEKIMQYRKTIQNYNLQIIEELNPLFFALY